MILSRSKSVEDKREAIENFKSLLQGNYNPNECLYFLALTSFSLERYEDARYGHITDWKDILYIYSFNYLWTYQELLWTSVPGATGFPSDTATTSSHRSQAQGESAEGAGSRHRIRRTHCYRSRYRSSWSWSLVISEKVTTLFRISWSNYHSMFHVFTIEKSVYDNFDVSSRYLVAYIVIMKL